MHELNPTPQKTSRSFDLTTIGATLSPLAIKCGIPASGLVSTLVSNNTKKSEDN